MKQKLFSIFIFFGWLLLSQTGQAQNNVYHSVLHEGTWFRIPITQEGVYKLDYATLQSMGMDMSALDPNQIRMFGNPSGALPEKNGEPRPDDLTEMALYVSGSEDDIFNEDDFVLFYAQEPTCWTLVGEKYQRERNYYSDTIYYYLCHDSGMDGLRVDERASLAVENVTTVVAEFPDFQWHEEELMSPYNIGRNWFGEMLNSQESELHIDFVFPYLATDKVLSFNASVLGRCKSTSMHYNLRINNNQLVNNGVIGKYGDHYYGKLANANGQFFLESDTAHFTLSTNPDETKATLYFDYIEIFAWRQLKMVGDLFPFRLKPSQLGEEKSAIWIRNVGSQHWLWDVSNPLVPIKQLGRLSSDNFVFVIDEKVEKRYMMFNPSKALPILSWTAIDNQDLHSIADADMLIITDRSLMQQAEELADFHREKDGMLIEVVDVKQIYNEFSTGTPDPSGIRDFIRMVYYRSAGNLKYVTLFGRASFDYRDIKGSHLNLVPCYEMKEKSHHEISFCTDDFFGLMDDGEGSNSTGHIDLGIGRIPVVTPEEAEVALSKIKHYSDLVSTHGDWKTNHLFISDDDKSEYVTNNEEYDTIMNRVSPAMNRNKIYCGAYQKVSTSSGYRFPQVTTDILDRISDGQLTMTYTGHGGVVALADERIFGTTEIATLTNYDRMPFVFTATCEFSKYDNPFLVSAGERLFLNPNGGAIAMLTTCRPTYGINNVKMGRCLASALYNRDADGKPLRFGDIVREAKANNANFSTNSLLSLNISHVMFGDPALRLALPEEQVKTLKINGISVDENEIEIHAMSVVNLEGEITTYAGQTDTQFNGELWLRFYDKKVPMRVAYEDGSVTVKTYKDVIYKGKASVHNGHFALSFQVPKDINLDFGVPRFGYYAYDSIRNIDAMGYFENLVLGGIDPTAVVDNEGPQISFYWNSPSFTDGDVVESNGILYADLYDEQGIYHYDFSLGRNIVLGSSSAEYNNKVLNNFYEPMLDDYRRGRVTLPVNDLAPGTYNFSLKVWDTHDNASETSLWLVVGEGSDIFLAQVRNYPNPFSEETYFTMAHFGDDGDFDLTIEIYDLMGRHVDRISKRVSSTNGVIEPVRWDRTGCLSSGIYTYRLTLTDDTGYSRSVSQRMMLCR